MGKKRYEVFGQGIGPLSEWDLCVFACLAGGQNWQSAVGNANGVVEEKRRLQETIEPSTGPGCSYKSRPIKR